MNESLLVILFVLVVVIVAIVGIVTSAIKGEQANCTTTRLTNSSFIVCTYKNKVLFNGEVKDED